MTLEDLTGRRVAVVRDYASADMIRRLSAGRLNSWKWTTFRQELRDVSFGMARLVSVVQLTSHGLPIFFSTVGDMFQKSAIATVTGIGGMAGGVGSMILQKVAGNLFVYADATQMTFMGFTGKPAGYFIIFCVCAVAYLIGWTIAEDFGPEI